MRKLMPAGVALAAAVLLSRLYRSKAGPTDWAKKIEAMPDNAPPKWIFNTLSATLENTEKILDLLRPPDESPAHSSAAPDSATVGSL